MFYNIHISTYIALDINKLEYLKGNKIRFKFDYFTNSFDVLIL